LLFMDIVGYSKLATDNQTGVYRQLQDVVGSTETHRRVKAGKRMISRSTGDGMALVFFDGPKVAVQCATEISSALQRTPEIKLRMGINTGPVYRVKDMNEADDVAGAGINMAQRVMDCGDAGHILVSRSVAEVLKEIGEWRQCLHDLGQHRVKHGAPVHLFNLCSDRFGNPRLPDKLRQKRTRKLVVSVIAILVVLAIALGVLRTLRKGNSDAISVKDGAPAMASVSAVVSPTAAVAEAGSVENTRSLSYSLKVQKYRNDKPYKSPILIAGADTTIFEKDDRLKLIFASGQRGYFYLLNEPPNSSRESPKYIILGASTESSDYPAPLVGEFPSDTWLRFDEKEGAETIWLVWSAQKIPALESVKSLDTEQAKGSIKDPKQLKAIDEFLKTYQASQILATQNDTKTGRALKANGELLVFRLVLEHH
jgi:class 3 adenylate cyclase